MVFAGRIPKKGRSAMGTREAAGMGMAPVIHQTAVTQVIARVIAACCGMPKVLARSQRRSPVIGVAQMASDFSDGMSMRLAHESRE
jgi:hypothetical protein